MALVYNMTDFLTTSKGLNLNWCPVGSADNPTQGTQCGVNDVPVSQRLVETRHGAYMIKISHT